jgi:uncharacterized protein YdhG (YjbR/CyaY superfamily)
MKKTVQKSPKVTAFINKYPAGTRKILQKIRDTIQKAAPGAEEGMGYGMPAYKLNGPLAYFSGFKSHIGLYPIPSGISRFKKEISGYKHERGSVQFPLDRPIPYGLITKIVKFRAKENLSRKKK